LSCSKLSLVGISFAIVFILVVSSSFLVFRFVLLAIRSYSIVKI